MKNKFNGKWKCRKCGKIRWNNKDAMEPRGIVCECGNNLYELVRE